MGSDSFKRKKIINANFSKRNPKSRLKMTTITRQSKLFPKEPHYIPGYRGYCPQMNFKMGQTYGKTTHDILSNEKIAKSARRVLAQTTVDQSKETIEITKTNTSKNRRAISFGDKKLTNDMVPGYTGYIPKKEDHFGNRYAVGCHRAIYDFEENKNHYADGNRHRMHITKRERQMPIRSEPAPYVSIKQIQHSVSPYFMESGNPGKTFMSGYTGFIPCARSHFANVYPVMTETALTEFTEDRSKQRRVAKKSVDVQSILHADNSKKASSGPMKQSHSIYRTKEGLLPRYTGYLPGHKYRYGVTFGTSARYYHNS